MRHLFFCVTLFMIFSAQANSPVSGTCNDNGTCLWSLSSDGTMTISAKEGAENVIMKNYNCSGRNCSEEPGNRPWEDYLQQITNLVVEDNIMTIGKDAFQDAHNLQSVTGMKDVKNINNGAFSRTDSLTSIDMTNVENIQTMAFFAATKLESVDLPNIKKIGDQAFIYDTKLNYVGLPEGKNVEFSGDPFPNLTKMSGCSSSNREMCGTCDNYIKRGIGCVGNCGDGYLGKEGKCIENSLGCGFNYKEIYGFCERIRYSLPEADAATSNDNENMIEWIFE
ncbi:MAG: leucine-rich repeat domain-containing protein [Alphaproteobacteria bacterium]|nr:leucine-rich repeat domain-containing protein [Alphaproteobacteria bacterium]